MAKSQTQQATTAAGNLISGAPGQFAPVIGGLNSSIGNATGSQQGLLSSATGGYQQQQTTGGYNPTALAGLRSTGADLTATGGYNPDQLSTLQGSMQDATSRGGYDPGMLSTITAGATSGAGYNPANASTISNTYSDLASTGGFTPAQAEGFKREATSGVQNTYKTLENQASQDRARTGGLGTGGDRAQMARQLAQEQAKTTLSAENQLNQLQTSNKLAGAGGLNTSEANQAGLRLQGTGILANTAANQASNTMQGLRDQGSLQSSVAGGRRDAFGQSIGLESGVAAGSNAANAGLAHLYDTTTGQISEQGRQVLQAMGLQNSTQEAGIQALTQLSKNPGMLQTIMGSIIGLSGAGAGVAKAFS